MCDYGLISKIQRFSLGDGPGIRTTVFIQGCNLHCHWCHNPETIPANGAIMLYDNLCGVCGLCQKVCPKRIINNCHISDRTKCALCGKCEEICPNNAIIISGKKMSVGHVYDYVAEDMAYYNESGGGITISGGEPLLQPGFCTALAKKCAKNDINVIIDTAGDVPFTYFEQMIPYVDCFYYDIKTTPTGYANIGGDGDRTYDNLKRLSRLCSVVVRIPTITGYNDSNMGNITQNLRIMGISEIEFLPFHSLGTGKNRALGLS